MWYRRFSRMRPDVSQAPKRMSSFRVWLLALLAWPLLMGQSTCQVRSPLVSAKKSYGANAKAIYTYARRLLKSGSYQESRKAFQRIKTKYPFSKFATLADLGIGDAYFGGGKFLRAVDIYKLFYKLHPTHEEAGYAAYRVGESYDKLRPFQWFLIPAPHHKDTTHTKQAVMAFREFISHFPKHKLVPKARKKMLFSLNLMAQQELNVAKFYAKRGKYRAVVWRMDFLLKTYPKVQLTAEARFFKADALRRLKRYTEAETEFGTIVKDHPKSSFANQAKGWIPKMKQLAKQTSKPKSPKPSSGGKKPTARPKAR